MRTFLYRLLRLYYRIRRPVTLGARTLVIKDGKVLLVRLTYLKGWCLPGGGVAKNESFLEAAVRELREECALEAHDPKLFGLYFNTHQGRPDHVAIYTVHSFSEIAGRKPDAEIAEVKFFGLHQLPDGIMKGSRRRIEEYLAGGAPPSQW